MADFNEKIRNLKVELQLYIMNLLTGWRWGENGLLNTLLFCLDSGWMEAEGIGDLENPFT